MAHHDPQLWRRHKERKQREGGERPQAREAAALRQQRQRIRALRDRMRGSEELEFRA
jgi:hypothetical protein